MEEYYKFPDQEENYRWCFPLTDEIFEKNQDIVVMVTLNPDSSWKSYPIQQQSIKYMSSCPNTNFVL